VEIKLRKLQFGCKSSKLFRKYYIHYLILGPVVALLIGFAVATPFSEINLEKKKQISHAQARTIVLTYLKFQGYKTQSSKFDLENESDSREYPDFYMFHAYYNTATRLNSIGAYAVNRKNADLWDRLLCQRLESKPLLELQNKLRREMGLSKLDGKSANPCF
jgi:hypothetical protein